MALNYYSQHEDRTDTTEHLKDSTFKMVVVGYGIPQCILLVVVVNLAVGRVVMPDWRFHGDLLDGLFRSYPYGWQFTGIVTMKAGVAAALFSWYGLANHERTEQWAEVALLVSIVFIAAGLGVYAAGFLI
jgi:hypothetical protein